MGFQNITLIKFLVERTFMKIYSIFHPIKKQIFLWSFNGKQYSDSPRAISEKMHKLFPDYKIVWWIKETNDKYGIIPDYVTIMNGSRYYLFTTIAESFCFVSNENMSSGFNKRKKQFFIQTWHGDRAPKKVLYDAYTNGKRPFPVADERVTDLCIAGSDYGESVYRSAFGYNGKVLKVGMPRNDKLIKCSVDETHIIRSRLKINDDTKILLFAPTFRDGLKSKQDASVNLKRILALLSQNGQRWICLVRAHPASAGLDVVYDDVCRNVTNYPDMADLLLISDMLITDYSSSAGDFILKDKPVIMAAFDYEEYQKNCREFKYSLEEAGFLIAKNQEELERIISVYSTEDYRKNCAKIKKYFNIVETGKSSEEVCKIINFQYDSFFGEAKKKNG